MTGAADAQPSVKRDTGGTILMTSEWIKDGPEGETLASRLEQIEVGIDDDGDPITSCIVVPIEGVQPRSTAPRVRIPKAAQIALKALDRAIDDLPDEPPTSPSVPLGALPVRIEDWRQWAYRLGICTSEEPRSRRMAFQRATESLIAAGVVAVLDDLAWRTVKTTLH